MAANNIVLSAPAEITATQAVPTTATLPPDAQPNPVVFFDITLGGEPLGRIKFTLYAHIVPLTAENFRQFCTGESLNLVGKPQGYKGCRFHRIIKGFMLQGGDFISGNGMGSACIYGAKQSFADENLSLRHDAAGLLSMANSGPNTNGCQFFITLAPQAHLDGKHVVFGKVLDDGQSMDVVRKMEQVRTKNGDRPALDLLISQCGEM